MTRQGVNGPRPAVPPPEGTAWEVDLEQADTVIGRYRLQSDQWPDPDYAPQANGLGFSPDCTQFAIVLNGLVFAEGEGRQELWVLDIRSRSLARVLVGRGASFIYWNFPVQSAIAT